MPTIIIHPEQRRLEDVTAPEIEQSGVVDKRELLGLRRQLVNAANPFVALLEEPANHHSSVHYHTSSEVMVVLQGRMMVNGQWCGPGTVVYIDEGEEYWHSTGSEPCVTALIRPVSKATLAPGADHRAMLEASASAVSAS